MRVAGVTPRRTKGNATALFEQAPMGWGCHGISFCGREVGALVISLVWI